MDHETPHPAKHDTGQVTTVQGEGPAWLRVPQPDLADSFRKAKAALEDASKDIAALKRRAGELTRRPG